MLLRIINGLLIMVNIVLIGLFVLAMVKLSGR
jgi:hypothetical protein